MSVTNSTILDRVHLIATNDYQQRIPLTTQNGVSATMRALFDPLNRQYYNQFIDILINRIGMSIVRGDTWDNPLQVFKGAKLNYGSTIQEIAPEWIKAHSYDDADETLLKLERPKAQAWYHSQNRRDKYKISYNEPELKTAFTEEYGLNNFMLKLMQVPYNSDNYDEYRIMMQLMAEYENNWGFYKHGLAAYGVSPIDQKALNEELLTVIQEYAGVLQFPSALYNALDVDIPVFAKPSELVLFITPHTLAGLNVQTLANVFNLDKAEIKYRTIVVDEFPIANCDAILTTEDFFVCHDTLYQTDTFYDPNTLTNHYYLHHWGVYSVSPFVPAIAIGNFETTSINSVVYGPEEGEVITWGWIEDANGDVLFTNDNVFSGLSRNPYTWTDSQVIDVLNSFDATSLDDYMDLDDMGVTNPSVIQLYPIVNGALVTDEDVIADSDLVLKSTNSPFTNQVWHVANWSVTFGYSTWVETDRVFTPYSDGDMVNSRTYIDNSGKLHLQKLSRVEYDPENGFTIQVTAEVRRDNPSSDTYSSIDEISRFIIFYIDVKPGQ